jgi:hypothetical protein
LFNNNYGNRELCTKSQKSSSKHYQKGTFNFKDKQLGDIGLNYKTKIDHQPVTLTAKIKDPTSTFSGNFNPSNLQVGAKLSIPPGKKSHGTQL